MLENENATPHTTGPTRNYFKGERFTVGQRKKVTAVTFFPARPRPDQRGTNTGQIRKVPVDEIA